MSPYGRMLLGLAWPLIATASIAVMALPFVTTPASHAVDDDAVLGLAAQLVDSGPFGLIALAFALAALLHGFWRYLRWERGESASCPRCTMLLGRRRGSPARRRCLGCGHRIVERRSVDRPATGSLVR
jgi:hypothetical protein